MKWNMVFGALVVSVGLCGRGFGFELLDRMLGLNDCGCNSCCQTSEPSCGCDKGCEPSCCAAAAEPSCCAAPACEASCGCAAAPSCGCAAPELWKQRLRKLLQEELAAIVVCWTACFRVTTAARSAAASRLAVAPPRAVAVPLLRAAVAPLRLNRLAVPLLRLANRLVPLPRAVVVPLPLAETAAEAAARRAAATVAC